MSVEGNTSILQALAEGKLTVPDPVTGFHHSIYGQCPHDGEETSIRRVIRGSGGAITEVTMLCSRCGREFRPPLASLQLH